MKRRKFLGCSFLSGLAVALKGEENPMNMWTSHAVFSNQQEKIVEHITIQEDQVNYYMSGLDKPFKVLFLSDTHYTIEDERGKPYYDFSKRMGGEAAKPENYGKSNGREKALLASLEKAKENQVELVILGGDIINFPSLASVESLKKILDDSGLPWAYISGNHDWHYEGEKGTEFDLRKKWTHSVLLPLYQGNNPMCYAKVVHRINFLFIDDSIYEITQEQLQFLQKEIKRGLPIIVSMHIPIYFPGHSVFYGCGSPIWNEAHDHLYQIERRLPWPKEGHKEITYQFRKLLLDSPEVIGVLAGHTHEKKIDTWQHKIQYVSAANFTGKDVMIQFLSGQD